MAGKIDTNMASPGPAGRPDPCAPTLALVVLFACSACEADRHLGDFLLGDGLGSGRDGVLQVDQPGAVVNHYVPLAREAVPGARSLFLTEAAPAAFAPDSLLLVWQSAGVVVGGADEDIDLGSSAIGHFELARLRRAEGRELLLYTDLERRYAATGAQVVHVPEFEEVRIAAEGRVVAQPWDGVRGGLIAFLVRGRLLADGAVSATGAGFRGGAQGNLKEFTTGCAGLDEASPRGAGKGESFVLGAFSATATGRGHLATGGGGGVCWRSGGGGGGLIGRGGTGGWSSNGDGSRKVGGLGGVAVLGEGDRLLMGGGGGGGHGSGMQPRAGAPGGGAVFVRAGNLAGNVDANGAKATDDFDDGVGGGGGGGTVQLFTRTTTGRCGRIEARGGDGGMVRSSDGAPYGPGGGGGGGRVDLHGAVAECVANAAGGAGGLIDGMRAYGATGGGPGRVERR